MISDKKSDESLIEILNELTNEQKLQISKIIYANGPGSFMGTKVSYIVLKTFSMVKECEFYAISGFELNGNGAIKANKALSFVKTGDEILLQKAEPKEFELPLNLDVLNLNLDTLPNYVIQAV
ncbi:MULTISPECIES: glycoprotease [unclassified Campylobacter]|uniref:glycoprotease n=1 Tax=unclassified Campylobacter TaxID=2593542 RepID=UPI001551AF7F|nr:MULTISPECIES: glycoprotease [unclassified Campylobacter]QKF92786.1 N6-L-threonylcarbamoyladenine synthase, TsaB subunit [Campylobacter sp. CCUG 57310]